MPSYKQSTYRNSSSAKALFNESLSTKCFRDENKSESVEDALKNLEKFASTIKKDIIDTLYPIGRVILSLDSTNPGTYIPGTTWQLIAGNRYLKGVPINTTVGTGGRDSYTISHSHSVSNHTHSIDGHTHTVGAHSHSITHNHTCDNHILTTAELPAHNHSVGAHSHSLDGHYHGLSINTGNTSHDHVHTINLATGGMSANNYGHVTDVPLQSRVQGHYVTGCIYGEPLNNSWVGWAYHGEDDQHEQRVISETHNGHYLGDAIAINVAHTHQISGTTLGQSDNHTHFISGNTNGCVSQNTANSSAFNSGNTGSGSGHNHTIQNYTGNSGNSSAFNSGSTSLTTNSSGSQTLSSTQTITLDPSYQSVYVYKRVA